MYYIYRTNYFEEGGLVHPYMEEPVAYEKALRTWATWVDAKTNICFCLGTALQQPRNLTWADIFQNCSKEYQNYRTLQARNVGCPSFSTSSGELVTGLSVEFHSRKIIYIEFEWYLNHN